MREILASEITKAVEKLSIDASYYLTEDVLCGLKKAAVTEESPLGKEIIETIVENAVLAKENDVPICQDTGMAVIFVKLGQDVHIIGGDIYQAINAGVASGYTKG